MAFNNVITRIIYGIYYILIIVEFFIISCTGVIVVIGAIIINGNNIGSIGFIIIIG